MSNSNIVNERVTDFTDALTAFNNKVINREPLTVMDYVTFIARSYSVLKFITLGSLQETIEKVLNKK